MLKNRRKTGCAGHGTLTFLSSMSFLFVVAPLAANEPGAPPHAPPRSSPIVPAPDQYCAEAARPCLSGSPLLPLERRGYEHDGPTGYATGLELGEYGPLRLKFTGKRIKFRFAF